MTEISCVVCQAPVAYEKAEIVPTGYACVGCAARAREANVTGAGFGSSVRPSGSMTGIALMVAGGTMAVLRNPVLGVAVLCVGVASLLVRSRA
jgi:hypothetical protein